MHGTIRHVGRYSDRLRAGRSGNRFPVRARFSAPVQTGPGAHPASCTMGTGSFLGVNSSQCVMLTPRPILVPWSWMGRAIPLLPLWAVWPVQSLSACTRVRFTLRYYRTHWYGVVTVWTCIQKLSEKSFVPSVLNCCDSLTLWPWKWTFKW
jgi:hypothetical protein